MRLIDKISWFFVWGIFAYIVSIPVRVLYDSIKIGWGKDGK